MSAIKNDTLDFEDLNSWPALLFVRAYKSLMNVLYKSTPSSKPTPDPSTAPFTPPNQTSVPADPNFSKESALSADSASSAASKAEHFTEKFIDAFVEASFESVRRYLGGLPWLDPCQTFTLKFTSIPFSFLCLQIVPNTNRRSDLACKLSRR